MTQDCCPVCGATRDDLLTYACCPLDEDTSDEWELDNCLELVQWEREREERAAALLAAGKLPAPPPWAVRLMEWAAERRAEIDEEVE